MIGRFTKRGALLRITAMFLAAFVLAGSVTVSVQASAQASISTAPGTTKTKEKELRGVWISYLDWDKLPADEAGFQKGVDQILDRCVELNMNAVFVHVRPYADAMYPSEYFPWSRFVTGTQGQEPDYDPLQHFIEAADDRDLQFHAWINPYQVTGSNNRWEQVSDRHPAKVWLSDADSSNDRWVLKQGGSYYLNPSVPKIRELITSGVREILENYNVDGIHFDDIFYPAVNDQDESQWFDLPEYEAAGTSLKPEQWRRENVNILIRQVYQMIDEMNPNVRFGVTTNGYVEDLRSSSQFFMDVDTWMSQEGYVDYVMPQLFWGFEHRLPSGRLAPYAFENNLKTWIGLKKKGNVKLYLGLAMHKTGSGTRDNNRVPEWLRRGDIIRRQVEAGRASQEIAGYCFYSYSAFQDSTSRAEISNLMKIFK